MFGRSRYVIFLCLPALLILFSCNASKNKMAAGSAGVAALRGANVVLVTIDTLRPDHLGCYGYSKIETPNLDRFAKQGVLFENAVAQAPLTAPSHASMMTGVYPTVHKVRDTGGFVLPSSQMTLASILQSQGWDTAAFVGSSVLRKSFGFNHGFAVYDDEMPKLGASSEAGEAPERRAGEVVDRAIRWLGAQSGKPFFLWVHVYDPHLRYQPPSPFAEKYRDRPYDGEIAYTDQQLGRLFDAVSKKTGGANTLTAVLSDHGESLSEHGEYSHGVFLYDSTLRIAFMMNGPGIPAGIRVKQQARSIDLLPTILEVMGGKAPQGIQGISLIPAFKGKPVPDSVSYAETLFPKLNMGWAELRGVRTNRWKYIRAPKPELYDLAADAAESRNVIADHPKEAKELDAQLKSAAGAQGSQAAEKVQTAVVDQQTMEQLKSLGYTGSFSRREYELNGKGADPKDRIAILKDLYAAEYGNLPVQKRIETLRRALAEDPANPTIYTHLGDIYERSGRAAEALDLYQNAVNRGIVIDWIYTRMGYLYLAQGNRGAAIAAWEASAQLNPTDYETMSNLGLAYIESGRIQDAERVCKWVLQTGAQYAPAYNVLGIASFQKNDLPAARGYFEKVVQLDPNLLDGYLNLGRVYKLSGDKARARATFETFLARAPRTEYAQVIPKIKAEVAELQ